MADKKLYVQSRKSVTSKRGLLAEGTEVSADDFGGGEDSIKGLIAKGIIGTKKLVIVEEAEVKVEEKPEEKSDSKSKANKNK